MTVSELIQSLAQFAPGAEVCMEVDCQSPPVRSVYKDSDMVVLSEYEERESQP